MADKTHEYAFDLNLLVSVRLNARSLSEAVAQIESHFDCAEVNLGEIDGETVVAEASLDGDPELFEFDGNPAEAVGGKIQITLKDSEG